MFRLGDAAFRGLFAAACCGLILPLEARAGREDSDFDGDGRADLGVYHASQGQWYIRQSGSGQLRAQQFGWNQSQPVPGDYDGDKRADLTVYSQAGVWYQILSANGAYREVADWGSNESDPIAGDFDGDGRNDLVVYHPPKGDWYIQRSSDAVRYKVTWGSSETEPTPGDFDGDGKTDLAVYHRPGGNWFVVRSANSIPFQQNWGWSEAEPVQADYDGDGKTDFAVFHAALGDWYILQSASGQGLVVNPGWSGVQPVPNDYDGDGHADVAVYDHRFGNWLILDSANSKPRLQNWGWPAAEPIYASYRIDDDGVHYGHGYDHDYDEAGFQSSGLYPRTGVQGQAPTGNTVPADFAGVEWLHTDVSDWAQTAKLTVSLTSSQIILDYDKANVWPPKGDPPVVANPWIFVPKEGGGWYAATFEWMRPGQTAKSLSSVKGDHIKKDPLQNFVPVSGVWYGFMVSGLCRDSKRNVYERSNVYMLQWP
jgi:hypothetical protein